MTFSYLLHMRLGKLGQIAVYNFLAYSFHINLGVPVSDNRIYWTPMQLVFMTIVNPNYCTYSIVMAHRSLYCVFLVKVSYSVIYRAFSNIDHRFIVHRYCKAVFTTVVDQSRV